jgi:hypothetical protein
MSNKGFQYIQNGVAQTGFYDVVTNTFVGVGRTITTVMNPGNPANYLANLVSRGL